MLFGPKKWFAPDDPALVCAPQEANLRTGGIPQFGNVESFTYELRGASGPNPNYWEQIELPGPCVVRANMIGQSDITQNVSYAMQYLGFFYAPGNREPQSPDYSMHSRGAGEGYCPHGGKWWFRPVRTDVNPLSLTFIPQICPCPSPWMIDGIGAANFHSHFGIALEAMANDGVTPTLPAANTYYAHYAYGIRKNCLIYVPRVVYVNNGGGNWTNASDTVVDQEASGALLGISEFLLANNFQQFNQWDTSPPSNVGRGLKTLRAGDRYVMSGDFRFLGPFLLFNLNKSGRTYVTIEEWT